MLADCHTHLDSYPDDEVPEILSRAKDAGVGFVIVAGTTIVSSERSLELSMKFPELFAGIGMHPMDLERPLDDASLERLHVMANSTEKVLVMSEIGLDFMDGMPERPIQYQALREQVRIALDLGLPIVFHSRCAHEEVLRIFREEQAYKVGGAMHYFQADLKTAHKAIDLGFYISLAKPLLRLQGLQKVAAQLPLSSIVLETDAFPQPFKTNRQNWTEPRHLRDIAHKLAALQKTTFEEVELATTTNLLRMVDGETVRKYVEVQV